MIRCNLRLDTSIKVGETSVQFSINSEVETPSLMLEISAALDSMSRTETAVFSVDASDSDSDSTVEYNAPEYTKPNEDMTDEDKPIEIDLTKGELIELNEEARMNIPIATESDENTEHDNLGDTVNKEKSK